MSSQLVHLDECPGFSKALASGAVAVNADGPMPRSLGWRNVPNLAFKVVEIRSVAHVAKIAKSIVGSIVVDVVNNVRLLVVGKKPGDAVRVITLPFMRVGYVAIQQRVANWLASLPSRVGFAAMEQPGIRIVEDGFSNRVRDWVRFHLASMPYKMRSSSITMEAKHEH